MQLYGDEKYALLLRNLLSGCAIMHQNRLPRRKYCPNFPKEDSVVVSNYVLSFEADYSPRGRRHHWMICATVNPEEMVSWGHAPTRRLAELAAWSEVTKLEPGLNAPEPAGPISDDLDTVGVGLLSAIETGRWRQSRR